MFVGRESEVAALREQFASTRRSVVLVYGKRRVGKSTLIEEAAKGFDGAVVQHLCVQSTFEGNLALLCRSLGRALGLPGLRFDHLYDIFDFLAERAQPVLLVIDEYQYLKQSLPGNEVDSYFQAIADALPAHVKLVLCGSYITVMRELLEEQNPLFGRFTSIVHLREFDYFDAARFCPGKSPYEKAAYYALFGGSPFVLSALDYDASPAENVERLLLPETGVLRTHVESVMLREVGRSFDVRILEALGNGRKRYSEIQGIVGGRATGQLAKQLNSLQGMETIRKTSPVNRRGDKKKQFYEISDNLMRLYFAYVFANTSVLASIGERAFLRGEVEPTLAQFTSRRFEGIATEYCLRMSRAGELSGVRDIGSYWYDDPQTRTNGEFDCVLDRGGVLDFYECKYFDRPMTLAECEVEERQVKALQGVIGSRIGSVGFVCAGGFDFEGTAYELVSGSDLYAL